MYGVLRDKAFGAPDPVEPVSDLDGVPFMQGIENTATEAKTAFQEGRYDAAKQAAETVLAKNPNYADMRSIVARSESRILYEDGRKIAVAGDYLQADSKFKEAVTKDSANAAAQKALDTSLQYQFLVSKKAFPQAQTIDRVRFDRERPDLDLDFDKVAAIKEANDSFASTDYGSARKKIEEVIRRDPTNPAALALRRRLCPIHFVPPTLSGHFVWPLCLSYDKVDGQGGQTKWPDKVARQSGQTK